MTGDNNKNEESITLVVERSRGEFRFSKMWGYIIKIPGNLPTMPLPWYYYIGITTQFDPMARIRQHPYEYKRNPPFEEIRKFVPFDLWEITIFEIPIIGSDGEQNIERLKQWEKETIAKYDTFHAEYGLNATPGGEDPFDVGRPIGWATGIAYTGWDNRGQTWIYDNSVHPRIADKDLNILSMRSEKLSQEIGITHIIDPDKAAYYINLSNSYANNIQLKNHVFGAKQISVIKSSRYKKGFAFTWQRRENGKKKINGRIAASAFLQLLKENADLDDIFFNFNTFVYKSSAVHLGYFDFDQKTVAPTFITQDQFNTYYNFTVDQVDAAMEFLKVIEAGVIPEPIKVLLPQTLNT